MPAHLGPVFRVPDVEDTVVVDKVKTPVSVPRVPNGVCPGVFFKFVVQEAIAVAIKGVAMSCPCPAPALIAPLGPESWIVDIEPAIITVESLVVDQVVVVDFVARVVLGEYMGVFGICLSHCSGNRSKSRSLIGGSESSGLSSSRHDSKYLCRSFHV